MSPVVAATSPAEDNSKPASFWSLQTQSNSKSILSSVGSSHSLQGPRQFQTIFGIYDAAWDLAKSWADWPCLPNGLKAPMTLGHITSETGRHTKWGEAHRRRGPMSWPMGQRGATAPREMHDGSLRARGVSGSSLPGPELMSGRCQMKNKHEWGPNTAIKAWFAEGSHHKEMTDNIQMGHGLEKGPRTIWKHTGGSGHVWIWNH